MLLPQCLCHTQSYLEDIAVKGEKSSLVQKKFLYFNGEGQLTKEEQSL
jgi:hypothetical protein